MIKLKFAALLAKKQKKSGIIYSQREMAEATGMSLRTVWKLHHDESGKFELLDALCKYLDCQPGDLLEYVPDK